MSAGDAGKRLEPPFDVSVPAPTPGSEDALLEAGRRLRALEDFWNDQRDPPEDAYAVEVDALQHFIAKTPVIGIAGLAVKFEEVLGLESLSGAAIGPDLAETITEALERLAKA